MAEPHIVCVCCQVVEVGVYELACDACRVQLEAAGLLAPRAEQPPKVQIGPTDI